MHPPLHPDVVAVDNGPNDLSGEVANISEQPLEVAPHTVLAVDRLSEARQRLVNVGVVKTRHDRFQISIGQRTNPPMSDRHRPAQLP